MKKFNQWFDRLKEPKRFQVFLLIFGGWLLPMALSDLIRPYSEVTAIVLGVIGGCWFFCVGMIGLERAFGHLRK